MASRDILSVASDTSNPSRRALLQGLVHVPVVLAVSPMAEHVATLHANYRDTPATIERTRAGRSLSGHRYHRAEGFFPNHRRLSVVDWRHFLYTAGITAQLALSSHLLDVGFSDQWCARHVGLHVAKSLAYANATGFGHDCLDMARLATVLTPYNVWNEVRLFGEAKPDDGNFTPDEVIRLLRALLERVHDVTGHSRPNGWWRDGRGKLS